MGDLGLIVVAPRGWRGASKLDARVTSLACAHVELDASGESDRAALARLRSAQQSLLAQSTGARSTGARSNRARSICVLGCGPGSALAFLFACTASDIAGCATIGGALVFPRLSAERPNQPLELALNLACPLHVFHGADDPDFPPAHVALARAKLEQFARDATFHAIAGAGAGWCDPAHPGYRPSSAQSAIERALAALAHSADGAAP